MLIDASSPSTIPNSQWQLKNHNLPKFCSYSNISIIRFFYHEKFAERLQGQLYILAILFWIVFFKWKCSACAQRGNENPEDPMKHPYCSSARLQRSGPPVADRVWRPWEGQHQPRRPQFWSASYSTAGGKEQQGGEAMCCFHVLSGSTRDRPKCPDVLVVSLPGRAHHHRFAMISACPWKLPTIPARLPRKKLQLRQKGLPYPSLKGDSAATDASQPRWRL